MGSNKTFPMIFYGQRKNIVLFTILGMQRNGKKIMFIYLRLHYQTKLRVEYSSLDFSPYLGFFRVRIKFTIVIILEFLPQLARLCQILCIVNTVVVQSR